MKIELKKRESKSKYHNYSLVINNIHDEESWVSDYEEGLNAKLYDNKAIGEVLKTTFSDMASHLNSLSFDLDFDSEWFDEIELTFIFNDSWRGTASSIKLACNIDIEQWAKPITVIEFAAYLEKIIRDWDEEKIEYFQDDEFILNGFGICFNQQRIDKPIKELLDESLLKVEEIIQATEEKILANINANSLSIFFNFPPEIRSSCEQYLIYFIQFLKDLDIEATSEIKHEAGKTLFSITPLNEDEALEKIREALSVYLQIPSDPSLEDVLHRNSDIAVKQLEANIYHLKGQLMLAQATLEMKDATIETLKISNYRSSEAINYKSDSTNKKIDSEEVLGGIVKVKSAEFKWGSIDLPEMLRRLKRKK